ncbi:unnamed protein product [Peronospora farinosa]|uniref:Uncharacterized protein n=1 Tax=Peronospora farinosa TaxID=134698 RepID=A0ABN8C0P0_9STRA|nr:unnamed protein product [Peronospora farinosa]
MLRQVSRTRVAVGAIAQSRRTFSVPPKAPHVPGTVQPIGAKSPSKIDLVTSAADATKSTSAAAAMDSNTGSFLPKLLLLGLLSTPAATALYVKQNPEWNPTTLKDDTRWIKFRELVLGKETTMEKKRSLEGLNAAIDKRQEKKEEAKEEKGEEKEKKEEKVRKEEKEKKEKKIEKKEKKEEKDEEKEKKEKKEKKKKKKEKGDLEADEVEKKEEEEGEKGKEREKEEGEG